MLLRSKHRLDKLASKAEEEEAKIRGLTEIRQNYIIRWHVQTPFPGGQGHINIVTSCEASMVWYGLKWSTPKVECSRKILSALCGAVLYPTSKPQGCRCFLYPTSKPQGCRCCWGKGAKVRREAVGSFSLRWSKPEAAFRALAPGSGEFEFFGELSRKPGYFYFPSFSHQTYYDLLYYVCIQRLNQSSDSMRAWEHGSSWFEQCRQGPYLHMGSYVKHDIFRTPAGSQFHANLMPNGNEAFLIRAVHWGAAQGIAWWKLAKCTSATWKTLRNIEYYW